MSEGKLYRAPQGWLKSAVDGLCAAGVEVVAPVATEAGVVNLAPVTTSEQIAADYVNVELPLKRLFLPITEILLEFEKKEDGDVDVRPHQAESGGETVVLGCRPCDAAGLPALDKVAEWDFDDVRYRARRERTTVVSFACARPDPECFCTSVGLSPYSSSGSDVLVFPGDDVLMQVNTEKGERFIERLGGGFEIAPDGAEPPAAPDVAVRVNPQNIKAWLDDNFESDFWSEASLRCVGCGVCTYLCPTCHCFDIVDEGSWNRGQRRRNWDSCSFSQFTVHASGHNPRPNQAARYRQRVMHKFKYFPERFDQVACVGCGRCVKTCGVGQSLIAVLSDIGSR